MFDFLFRSKYAQQQLSDAQLEIIQFIDVECEKRLSLAEAGTHMSLHHIHIPVAKHMLPTAALHKYVLSKLPAAGGYIPRSVAFIQSGLDWHIIVGVYKHEESEYLQQLMFVDLLTRTNTARTENSK